MFKLLIPLTIVLLPTLSYSESVSGYFAYSDKYFDFTKSLLHEGKCTGRIPYPVLANEDEDLTAQLNAEILDFVQLYAICNEGVRNNFSVSYDLPVSGLNDYFSIRWLTQKDGNLYRIDALTFDANNADLIMVDDLFNKLSASLIADIVKLSEGHLSGSITWEIFLDKIAKKEIQYYVKDKEWRLVFNSNHLNNKVTDIKIPDYFLQADVFDMN